MSIKEYVHLKLDEEIKSISGHMKFHEEKRMPYNGKELLYLTGYSSTDSTCCGVGAVVFSYVPGFIVKWHSKTSEDGNPISEVDTVTDEKDMKEITKLLLENKTCTQVNFM